MTDPQRPPQHYLDHLAAQSEAGDLDDLQYIDNAIQQMERSMADSENGLVSHIAEYVRNYVVISDDQAIVLALFIIHTYCLEACNQTPYLAVTSPEKQCGKTRLLEVLETVVHRPWRIELPSEAVLYRYINEKRPTVLFDELDPVFNPKTQMQYEGHRALLNAGNRRGVKVPRMIGTTGIAEFETFCPKVMAGIGALPDTLADRSIPIRLNRRLKSEFILPFKYLQAQKYGKGISSAIEEWATEEVVAGLKEATPDLPEELSDRMQEASEPLLAIADALDRGFDARRALVKLCSQQIDTVESYSLRLLRDMQVVFRATKAKQLTSHQLISKLERLEESPWANYYGRGFTPRDLASLLVHYDIKSKKLWLGGDNKTARGYRRDQLRPVWDRYLE